MITRATTPYTASLDPSFEAAFPAWEAMAEAGGALPFQRERWLAAWASTMGARPGTGLVAVTLRDAQGLPVAGLPLVRERRRGIRRIGFADGGLSDYNAPILGPLSPADPAGAHDLWLALRRALPAADVVRLERMPRRVGDRINPLALLGRARPSQAVGLALPLARGYDAWYAARPRRYRMELGRCARLFDALPGACFERVEAENAAVVLAELNRLQRARLTTLDKPYALDAPGVDAFHQAVTADTAAGCLFTLRAEGRVVAILFGVRDGSGFVMLRVTADPAYTRLSPARLVIIRAMAHLAADGVTSIDLGRGDYDYKRRLGGEPVALVDVVAAQSVLGAAELAGDLARAAARALPGAREAAQRLRAIFGKPGAARPALPGAATLSRPL